MNAYQSGARKAVPACLIYARAGGHVLMLHRDGAGPTGSADVHKGKWNGLGGKLEADESPLEGAVREFHEEAGVSLPGSAFAPLGVLQFPNFRADHREDWIVYVFTVRGGDALPAKPGPFRSSPEGKLHWVPEPELDALPLWEGDRKFLPLVLEERPFVGTFWYRDGRLERHWLKPL